MKKYMEQKLSLKGNIIRFDRSLVGKDIESVLAARFE
jgi:hypothetical protein